MNHYNYMPRVKVAYLEPMQKIDGEYENRYHRGYMAFLEIGE